MARVTKSYVTGAPRAGAVTAIGLRPSLSRRAVHDPGQVRDGGLGVELGMDVVAAGVVCKPGDERRLVVQIAEHDRFRRAGDRKSTRLNSSHLVISYAVFCLKKKKKN